MAHDFGERRHCADFETAGCLAHAAQLLDLTQVDDVARPLETIFQPVHAVKAAAQQQRVRSVLVKQPHCIVRRGRLEQLERRNHIPNHRHNPSIADSHPTAHSPRRGGPGWDCGLRNY